MIKQKSKRNGRPRMDANFNDEVDEIQWHLLMRLDKGNMRNLYLPGYPGEPLRRIRKDDQIWVDKVMNPKTPPF